MLYLVISYQLCLQKFILIYQISEEVPPVVKAHRPSVIQLYMSNFFRWLWFYICKFYVMVFGVLLFLCNVFNQLLIWFCRKYGSFVSKNPTLILCLSLVVPLLLCLGLIRFKVETRPEKVFFLIFSEIQLQEFMNLRVESSQKANSCTMDQKILDCLYLVHVSFIVHV